MIRKAGASRRRCSAPSPPAAVAARRRHRPARVAASAGGAIGSVARSARAAATAVGGQTGGRRGMSDAGGFVSGGALDSARRRSTSCRPAPTRPRCAIRSTTRRSRPTRDDFRIDYNMPALLVGGDQMISLRGTLDAQGRLRDRHRRRWLGDLRSGAGRRILRALQRDADRHPGRPRRGAAHGAIPARAHGGAVRRRRVALLRRADRHRRDPLDGFAGDRGRVDASGRHQPSDGAGRNGCATTLPSRAAAASVIVDREDPMTEPVEDEPPTCGRGARGQRRGPGGLARSHAARRDQPGGARALGWDRSPAARAEHEGMLRVAAAYRDMADAAERAAVLMRSLRALPAAPHDPTAFDARRLRGLDASQDRSAAGARRAARASRRDFGPRARIHGGQRSNVKPKSTVLANISSPVAMV